VAVASSNLFASDVRSLVFRRINASMIKTSTLRLKLQGCGIQTVRGAGGTICFATCAIVNSAFLSSSTQQNKRTSADRVFDVAIFRSF
jgi:hypothetical protein